MQRRYLTLLAIPLVALAGLVALMVPRPGASAQSLIGTDLQGRLAPDFRLVDSSGRTVSLSTFRGKPVLLTFMESQCAELCPLVAENVHRAVADVTRSGAKVGVIAVSTSPEHDTPASIAHFSRAHGLLGVWRYVNGSRARLAPVWRAYGIFAAPAAAPAAVRDGHTSAVYLIDSAGRERSLMANNPSAADLTHDLRILAGLPSEDTEISAGLPRPGQIAPDIAVQSIHGETVRLSHWRGAVVLLNFWATWCVPCGREIPVLAQTYRRWHDRGLVVVGVDKSETASDVRSYLRGKGVTYPVALDASGIASSRYGLPGMPDSFLIDRNGKIVATRLGEIDASWLQAHLHGILSGRL